MHVLLGVLGAGMVVIVLWDAFETIILPRRVNRQFRLTRFFYRTSWVFWRALTGTLPAKRRELYLGYYGPLSLIVLLVVWALGLLFGFALVGYAIGSHLSSSQDSVVSFWTDLYFSGTTFFTLGLGDITPRGPAARALVVFEAGMGFGFLALVIGYLPVIYQSFSRREVNISLLDARAGSPPSAGELLRRHAHDNGPEALCRLLEDWERWAADLMESHLSYAVLCYFRSQHSNQSWLAALTTIVDTCALLAVAGEGRCQEQAKLTFAIARHAIVDLSQIFIAKPLAPEADRLPHDQLARLRATIIASGFHLRQSADIDQKLAEMRNLYEPYVYPLARFLVMELPSWIPSGKLADNWQTTAWTKGTSLPVPQAMKDFRHEDHY